MITFLGLMRAVLLQDLKMKMNLRSTLTISKARWQHWLYASWFRIALRYRKTTLGPLWLLAGPAILIGALGYLYATIGGVAVELFVPHLAVGIIVWSLITSFMNGGTTVVFHNRPKMLHSAVKILDVVMINIFVAILQFLHHTLILVVVYFIFRWEIGPIAYISLIGLLLLIVNGVWYSIVFGILGVRFRDITEIISAMMGALFFLTPILWMPDSTGRGGILGPYLTYNPFYHYMELIRAPILGNKIETFSWIVVLSITFIGVCAAFIINKKLSKHLTTWF